MRHLIFEEVFKYLQNVRDDTDAEEGRYRVRKREKMEKLARESF